MKIAKLVRHKGLKVRARVPAQMRKAHPKLAETVTGTVVRLKRVPRAPRIIRIVVALKGGKTLEFRPQDLSAA